MPTGASSRPAEECEELAAGWVGALDMYRSNGGKVLGYLCSAFPPALGAGLGMLPARALTGAVQEMECEGERFVRPDVCPLVKSFLGAVSSGCGVHGRVDAWVGMYTCDQTRRLFQELSSFTGARVFHIQLPATRTTAARAFFQSQAGRLCRDLEASGLSDGFDPGRAEEWERHRRSAAEVLEAASLSGRVPPLLLHRMHALLCMTRPHGLDSTFGRLLGTCPPVSGGPLIGLTGSPMLLEDDCVPAALEECGAGMLPLGCTGLQACLPSVGEDGMTPAGLAGAWFDAAKCSRCRPNSNTYEWLASKLSEAGAKGLVVRALKFCDLWFAERERLKRLMPVPVLVLDSDYARGGRERTRTRVQAFLESLS